MRGVSKQNTIKRVRLKLIKISTFQNKVFASKRPEVRNRSLATKAKLKGVKYKIERKKIRLEI
jgi:hypothetical protein